MRPAEISPALAVLFAAALFTPPPARAIEIKISAQALERTLDKQLFSAQDGRYYLRGKSDAGCFAYAQDPKVSFVSDRVVIHVTAHAKLGAQIHKDCLGVPLSTAADVSVVPDAQGETIGFRDPRIDRLSESRELNFFLTPFLSKKLPQQMKLNVADLLRKLLANSAQTTGYTLSLDNLKIHSMQVSGDALVVDFDGDLSVH
jgi:hypothetical protein